MHAAEYRRCFADSEWIIPDIKSKICTLDVFGDHFDMNVTSHAPFMPAWRPPAPLGAYHYRGRSFA